MSAERDRGCGGPLTASVENRPDHREWDDFLTATAGGDLVQSSAWGRVKQSAGMEIQRVLVRQRGVLVGGAQLIVRRFGPFGSVAYLPFGPVIAPQAGDDTVVSLVEQLRRQVRRARIRALFVQPPDGGERVAAALRAVGFRPTRVKVAPSATVRLDVQLSPEELLDGMGKHAKREFRQSQRDPLTVRRAVRDDLGSFYELYCCTAARQGFEPLSSQYLASMWDELHPAGLLEIFLAEVDGTAVAVNLVTSFAGVVTGRLLGFDPDRLSQRMRPNEALVWAIIRWAADNGAKTLDVGGVDRAEAFDVSAGAAQHKTRLGGTPVLFPEPLELIPKRPLRAAFGAIQSSQLVRRLESRWRTDSSAKAKA